MPVAARQGCRRRGHTDRHAGAGRRGATRAGLVSRGRPRAATSASRSSSLSLHQPRPAAADDAPAPQLLAAHFGRRFDAAWRRNSYSGITAAAHEGPRVGSEADDSLIEDDDSTVAGRRVIHVPASVPASVPPDVSTPARTRTALWAGGSESGRAGSVPLLLGEMPGGTRVGTLVHRVLERVDFAAADLAAELRSNIEAELALRPRARAARAGDDGPRGSDQESPRSARRRRGAPRHRESRQARRARVRAAARRRRRDRGRALGRRRGRAAPPAAERRPALRLRGPVGGRGARRRAARLPHRQHRPRLQDGGPALLRRRLQDEPARRSGRAVDDRRLRARRPDGGDAPRPLPPPGASLRRGPPPVPEVARRRLRPGAPPRRRALPFPARHERCRGRVRRWLAVRGLVVAASIAGCRIGQRPARPGRAAT